MSSCASRSRSPSAGLRPGASALAEKRCVPNSGQTQQGRLRVWRRGTLNPISAMQVAGAMQMVSETHKEMSGHGKSSPRRRRVEAEWPYNTFKRISSFAALILLYANEVLFKIGVAGEEHEALHKYFMSDVERTTLFDNFKSKQRCTLSYKTDRSTLHFSVFSFVFAPLWLLWKKRSLTIMLVQQLQRFVWRNLNIMDRSGSAASANIPGRPTLMERTIATQTKS